MARQELERSQQQAQRLQEQVHELIQQVEESRLQQKPDVHAVVGHERTVTTIETSAPAASTADRSTQARSASRKKSAGRLRAHSGCCKYLHY